jgi:hypothetical protein
MTKLKNYAFPRSEKLAASPALPPRPNPEPQLTVPKPDPAKSIRGGWPATSSSTCA